jgi:hypothetical protein
VPWVTRAAALAARWAIGSTAMQFSRGFHASAPCFANHDGSTAVRVRNTYGSCVGSPILSRRRKPGEVQAAKRKHRIPACDALPSGCRGRGPRPAAAFVCRHPQRGGDAILGAGAGDLWRVVRVGGVFHRDPTSNTSFSRCPSSMSCTTSPGCSPGAFRSRVEIASCPKASGLAERRRPCRADGRVPRDGPW